MEHLTRLRDTWIQRPTCDHVIPRAGSILLSRVEITIGMVGNVSMTSLRRPLLLFRAKTSFDVPFGVFSVTCVQLVSELSTTVRRKNLLALRFVAPMS